MTQNRLAGGPRHHSAYRASSGQIITSQISRGNFRSQRLPLNNSHPIRVQLNFTKWCHLRLFPALPLPSQSLGPSLISGLPYGSHATCTLGKESQGTGSSPSAAWTQIGRPEQSPHEGGRDRPVLDRGWRGLAAGRTEYLHSPEVPKEPPRFRGHRAAPRAPGASLTAPRPASLGFLRRARQDGEGGRPWGRDGQRAVKQAAPGRRSPRPCPSGRSVPWRRRRKAQLAGPGRSRLLRPPQEVPGGRPR